MSAQAKRRKPPPHPVDRAVARARAAVGQVIELLCDEDRGTVERAAAALTEIGAFAVGPLAAALPRAGSARGRLAIAGALLALGPGDPGAAVRALARAVKRE